MLVTKGTVEHSGHALHTADNVLGIHAIVEQAGVRTVAVVARFGDLCWCCCCYDSGSNGSGDGYCWSCLETEQHSLKLGEP